MRLLIAIALMLGIAFSEVAVAKLKCTTHTLTPENDSVAAPSALFALKNNGPTSVMIVTGDGEIATLGVGKETMFVGDESFDYYIKPRASGDTTTIEICKF